MIYQKAWSSDWETETLCSVVLQMLYQSFSYLSNKKILITCYVVVEQ